MRSKWLALVLIFSAFACVDFIPSFAPISSDPALDWRTLETAHFRIHYYQGYSAEAQRVSQFCEEAHEKLSKEIQWEPWGKTHVVLIDGKDSPDAKAVQFPYPEMLIYTARPGLTDALASYDDWLRLVIFHEYTHILAMDAAGGFWHGARYLLGRVIMPASVVPNWMSEGYAVFQETKNTKAGRNRSNYVDMILRMDILEDNFPPIDTLTVDAGHWPFGSQAYFHGGRFFAWLAEKHPAEEIGEYNKRYASSFLNFALINHHAKNLYGDGFLGLYQTWQEDLKVRYAEQKAKIEAKGITPARRITFDGAEKIGLAYSSDGQGVLYSLRNGDQRTKLLLQSTQGKTPPEVIEVDFSTHDLTWNQERTELYYSSVGIWRDYYDYSSMSRMTWKDHKIRAIRFKGGPDKPERDRPRDPNHEGRRFFSPNLSADGGKLVFVGRDYDAENLWIAQTDPNGSFTWDKERVNLHRVTDNPTGTEMNQPVWSPDGRQIAVSIFDPQAGQRDLVLYDDQGKLLQHVTNDRALDQKPLWSPDGKRLYFVSDRSGVFNIYAFEVQSRQVQQVTNVLGGAFSPTLSPDGTRLAYLGYHAKGFDVYEMLLDPKMFFRSDARQTGRAARQEELIDPSNNEVSSEAPQIPDSTIYHPWPEIFLPRFIGPELFIVDVNDLEFGLTVGSTDALRRHTWTVNANYRSKINQAGGSFSYTYTRWYPKFFITGQVVPVAQSGILYVQSPLNGSIHAIFGDFDNGLLVQRDLIGHVGTSMKFPLRQTPGLSWVPGSHVISVSYEYLQRNNVSDINPLFVQFTGAPTKTQVFIPTEYKASGVEVDYAYDSTLRRARDISPTGEINKPMDWLRGYSLALGYELFNRALGGNWDQQILTADFRQYRRIPFTDHHVLALRGVLGLTMGQNPNPGTFNLGGAFSEGVINQTSRNFYPLRGFGGTIANGEQMFLLSGEYRFPIWIMERGIADLPLYIKAIHGAFFLDYGNAKDKFYATNDNLTYGNGYMGGGLELRSDFTFLYNLPGFGRLGYGIPLAAPSYSSFHNLPSFSNGGLILNFGTTF